MKSGRMNSRGWFRGKIKSIILSPNALKEAFKMDHGANKQCQ